VLSSHRRSQPSPARSGDRRCGVPGRTKPSCEPPIRRWPLDSDRPLAKGAAIVADSRRANKSATCRLARRVAALVNARRNRAPRRRRASDCGHGNSLRRTADAEPRQRARSSSRPGEILGSFLASAARLGLRIQIRLELGDDRLERPSLVQHMMFQHHERDLRVV
jgi:hypothetical protein